MKAIAIVGQRRARRPTRPTRASSISITDVRNKTGLDRLHRPAAARHDAADHRPRQRPLGGRARSRTRRFRVTVPCATTADTTVGSTCSVNTTADAVRRRGAVKEGRRSIWAARPGARQRRRLRRSRVHDAQQRVRRSGRSGPLIVKVSTGCRSPRSGPGTPSSDPETLRYITKGLLGFRTEGVLPARFAQGETYRVRLLFFGVVPAWWHEIHIARHRRRLARDPDLRARRVDQAVAPPDHRRRARPLPQPVHRRDRHPRRRCSPRSCGPTRSSSTATGRCAGGGSRVRCAISPRAARRPRPRRTAARPRRSRARGRSRGSRTRPARGRACAARTRPRPPCRGCRRRRPAPCP